MSERLIRLLRVRPPADGVADAELLRRWADRRDEAAFELLLRRHAEPVWRTCRAVAGPGAEDAFQATFLALARRAGAVRGNVPGWLHTVARHASVRARRAGGVSPPFQPPATTLARGEAGTGGLHPPLASEVAEAVEVLHAELARLPAAYRLPILLCHLHGRTQAEAARELGLPLGTVATRVRRGCDRLRVALTRRGLAPALDFGPPLILPASLVPAALGVGLGATAAPPAIHTLAQGAVSAMSRTKLKVLLAVVALAGAVTGGAIVARPPAAGPQPPKPAPPPAAQKWEPRPADYFDRTTGQERLKRALLAWHEYLDQHGHFPADLAGADGKPLLSWRVAVLPLLDQDFLYSQFKLNEPWDSEHNRRLLPHLPKLYRSSGAGAGETRLKAFRGPHAALDPAKPTTIESFTDGTSNTIGLAEAGPPVPWTKPSDLDYARDKPLPDLSGPFTDVFLTAYVDGSARTVRRSIDPGMLRLLIERDDGTPVNEDVPAPDRPGVSKAGGPGVGLPAGGKRPLTDREQKRAAFLHKWLTADREERWQHSVERAVLTAELAKFGPVPPPAVPAADDLDGLENAWRAQDARYSTDSNESQRLMELLKAKNPERAKALQEEFNKRWNEFIEARRKK